MPITVKFQPLALAETEQIVLPILPGGKLGRLGQQLDKKTDGALTRAMQAQDFSGKKNSQLSLLAPAGLSVPRIILLGLGKPAKLRAHDFEALGAAALAAGEGNPQPVVLLWEGAGDTELSAAEIGARFALGAQLRAYKFDRYKTKQKPKPAPKQLSIALADADAARAAYKELAALGDGICLARDLVNEPANILTPPEFAARAKKLAAHGVKVQVLSEAQMQKLGMGALLGVGQGSVQPSQLVIMQWMNGAKSKPPLAFVGKGVCFDTGGISIKPAGGMEDMRGDMGGAAAVTGLMQVLAMRKAKVNAVGVIGLVENMPSGEAQRPGDIVTSMSGQTIEVLNTDAEGRLVLADALWYTQKNFKPQFIIDLATLTGAIMVALGQEYAGLFSNNDALAERLVAIGEAENEKVWRMPICDRFDKMIDTPNADMKNIGGGRFAGSSTAAQFLQRFVDKTPWVHLDIAGTAMGSPKTAISKSWASGFGVRLLDRLVKAHYE